MVTWYGPYPKALRTNIFKAFGPKDHTIKGFWAILSLRVRVSDGELGSVVKGLVWLRLL